MYTINISVKTTFISKLFVGLVFFLFICLINVKITLVTLLKLNFSVQLKSVNLKQLLI